MNAQAGIAITQRYAAKILTKTWHITRSRHTSPLLGGFPSGARHDLQVRTPGAMRLHSEVLREPALFPHLVAEFDGVLPPILAVERGLPVGSKIDIEFPELGDSECADRVLVTGPCNIFTIVIRNSACSPWGIP